MKIHILWFLFYLLKWFPWTQAMANQCGDRALNLEIDARKGKK